MIYINNGFKHRAAWCLIWCMLFQTLIAPTQALALTNGPKQPEFDSFTPVSTTNMVNTFTGGFNYNLPVLNIPGADGGGYALSLSYDANPNVESQASWVGNGWTLNPGTMDRSKRGVPDDWNGKQIIREYNKNTPNLTLGVNGSVGLELASNDGNSSASLSIGNTYVYNNYTGFRQTQTIGASASTTDGSLGASANLGINLTGRDIGFTAGISFSISLKKDKDKAKKKKTAKANKAPKKQKELTKAEKATVAKVKSMGGKKTSFSLGASFNTASYLATSLAPTVTPYRGFSFNTQLQGRFGPTTIGARVGVGFSFDLKGNIPLIEHKPFGYMYNQNRHQHEAYNSNPANGAVQDPLGINPIPRPIMSDYYMEKAAPYSVRDNVVGIPFNNADNYTITGEGLSGSFRLRHNRVGHFYSNIALGDNVSFNIGGDVNIIAPPFGAGGGGNIGTGFSRTLASKWLLMPYGLGFDNMIDQYEFNGQAPDFRFTGDMGGKVEYGSMNLSSARLKPDPLGLPGAKFFGPEITGATGLAVDRNTNAPYSQTSSPIQYLKNSDISNDADFLSNGFDVSNQTKNLSRWSRESAANGGEDLSDAVAQMKVWNPDGVQYIYGLPTYVINEKNLNYGVKGNNPTLYYNNLVYQDVVVGHGPNHNNIVADNSKLVGQELIGSYASTYLLTQINTYDYIDRTGNGPSQDDFGGYTKFNYRKWVDTNPNNDGSTTNNLYAFRTPYTGLSYARNTIADGRDDMGSVQEGFKEMYYLKAVETKSHVAIFITNKTDGTTDFTDYGINDAKYSGSGEKRMDGIGANQDINTSNGKDYSKAAKDRTAKGEGQELEKLERIVLFAKDDLSKPLVCTYMEYDYSTWPNLPNNINGNYPFPNNDAQRNNGKLTLKKVWFEYEGVRPYKISPYEFNYEYKKASSIKQEVRNRYPEFFGNGSTIPSSWPAFSAGAECPDYSPHTLDAWGHHQFAGQEQSDKLRPWVWQGDQNPNVYDPAAWQLKQIILPSGGEILVQYEQKDYSKVQDRDPMAMVSLLPKSEDNNSSNTSNKYYLNLDDIGIAANDMAAKDAIVDAIQERYVDNQKNKMYFKFLYDLTGNNANLASPQAEYISGYSNVAAVGKDAANDVYVIIGSTNIDFTGPSTPQTDALPRRLCYDHIVYQYNFGKLSSANMADFEENQLSGADNWTQSEQKDLAKSVPQEVVDELLNPFNTSNQVIDNLSPVNSVCKDFNKTLSYLRIPMKKNKRGGGLRVKRIMMYDEGLETGAAELYGTEYSYENLDGSSSGVATNEPSAAREENALVEFEPRQMQSDFNRLFAGKDRKELEAPFGESLLPVQSVGHSRVVVQNIYKGETNSGFVEHTFYTCADYPYDYVYNVNGANMKGVHYSQISGEENDVHKQRDWMMLPLGFLNYNRDNVWVTQGWRFIQNDMNGKPKTVKNFGGNYKLDDLVDQNGDGVKDLPAASLETIYDYYEPGERANVMRYDKTNGKYIVQKEHLGMEMDVTMAMQAVQDESMDFNFEFDLGAFYPPGIEFTFSPSFSFSQKAYSSHLTSKVICFPAVTKSVTTTKNGTTTQTEHLAFSDLTGQPILTRVTDGYHDLYVPDGNNPPLAYDGSIYNWSIPAAWFYDELNRPDGGAAAKYNMLSATIGSITSYGEEGNVIADLNNDNSLKWTDDPKGVLSASAMTYNTGWLSTSGSQVETEYDIDQTDADYATTRAALNAIPRPHDTYIFEGLIDKDDIGGTAIASNSTNRNYEAGTIQDFDMFNWGLPPARSDQDTRPGWRWVSGVDKYSPNGYALEETNPLDIPSCAKYGYHKFLSTLVAQNAEYETVFFESFEDETAPTTATDARAHAGVKSLLIEDGSSWQQPIDIGISNKVKDTDRGGLQVKFWAYKAASNPVNFSTDVTLSLGGLNQNVEQVAQVGDWVLLASEFTAAQLNTLGNSAALSINNTGSIDLYMDDFRVQPRYAEMMTYVYNPKDFKVVATFDDEHFGVYYQYNEEGQLTRKYIETERGMKLLQESQYNSHTTPRDQ